MKKAKKDAIKKLVDNMSEFFESGLKFQDIVDEYSRLNGKRKKTKATKN